MSVATATLDDLYLLVTEQIVRAETLDDLGTPGAAQAHLDVSYVEEQIARLVPASEREGAIARRGAVRAALEAGAMSRARRLAGEFSLEPGANDDLRRDIAGLVPEYLWPMDLGDESSVLDDPHLSLVAPPLERPLIYVTWPLSGLSNRGYEAILRALSDVRVGLEVASLPSVIEGAQSQLQLILRRIVEADAVIVLGAGVSPRHDLAQVARRRVPILYLYQGKNPMTRGRAAMPLNLEIQPFVKPDDLYEVVLEWISRRWRLIEAGPLERRVLESRLAPVHAVLRARFNRLLLESDSPEEAFESLVVAAGMPPNSILTALERPIGLAAISYERLLLLAQALDVDIFAEAVLTTGGPPVTAAELEALDEARRENHWSSTSTRLLLEAAGLVRGKPGADLERQPLSTASSWVRLYELWHSGRLR